MVRELTYLQKRFVEEMILDPSNASAAAKRAGYSPTSSKEIAYDLLQDPRVREQIDEVNNAAIKRLGITKERILQELASIGFANLKHIMTQDADGNTDVNLAYLPEGLTAPITKIKITNGKKGKRDVDISLADKRQALMDLAKMMGWNKDQVEVTGKVSLEQLIEASMLPEDKSLSVKLEEDTVTV